jgi:hypothetical protein
MFASTSFKLAAAVSLMLLTLVTSRASAQRPSQEQIGAIRSACRGDFQARCTGVQPGGPEALACLKKNVAVLSSGCQKAVGSVDGGAAQKSGEAVVTNPSAVLAAEPGVATKAATPPVAAVAPPAAAPIARAVSTVPAARPAAPPRAELAVLRQACGRDYQANCAGVRPGGGQVVACLAANQARLSPGCQRALAMAKPGL